jgi:hypothetical protein
VSEPEQEQAQEQDGPEPDESQPDEQATPIQPPDEEEEGDEEERLAEPEELPEPEQPQALTEKDIEAIHNKLDREHKRHMSRIFEIMQGDVETLRPCPLCEPNMAGIVNMTPETEQRFPAVREFMGDAQPADYQQDPNTRTCMTCAGEGVVETGSRVESQRLLTCTDCGGKGWQGQRAPVATSGPMAPAPMPDANGQAEPVPQGPEPPEAAKLRALGYTLIQPVGAPS